MDYKYEIYGKNSTKRWIVLLSNDEHDCEKPDAYINFVERVNASGKAHDYNFTWDPVYCISVTYPETVTEDEAVSFLSNYVA